MMESERFCAHLRQLLEPTLREHDAILAAWEGGAIANDRFDAWSDLDLCLLVEAGKVDGVWERVEALLAASSPIESRWVVARGIWPNLSQRLYVLDEFSPTFFADVAIFERGEPLPILVEERHGTPRVWFDHGAHLVPAQLDRAAHGARMSQAFITAASSFEFYKRCALKAILRAQPLDAHQFYSTCLAQARVVLGLIHRPDRFDFGGRYLHHDLPEELAEELAALTYVKDIEDLRAKLELLEREMSAWLREASECV